MATIKPEAEGYVEAGGLRLHYMDWGNADAAHVLLVHGWDGTARYWDLVAPALKDRYHLVALSLRGRGKSDRDPTGEYPFAQYITDLREATQQLDMERLVFVGASLGGLVGQVYATEHPEQVAKLVVVDIGPQMGGDQSSEYATIRQRRIIPEEFESLQEAEAWLRQFDHQAKLDRAAMDLVLQEQLRHEPSGKWSWIWDKRLRELRRERPLEEMFPKEWHLLPKIQCPTLIIRGSRSESFLPEVAERMRQELPNAALVEIPDSGHFPFLERPKEFLILLRGFIG